MAQIEITKGIAFLQEEKTLSGVRKIAEKVKKDIKLVTNYLPEDCNQVGECKNLIIYGTLGYSDILDSLVERQIIDFSSIRSKWEVYQFTILDHPFEGVEHALVIAGSDKRGTIYGLFHLSELLGVSPLVNWNHVIPQKRDCVVLTDACNLVSKEPSVKYRGFFINDEWPAFANWAHNHFGGINAECYERVFELLLRLKGNYLWPAMWWSNFSLDGPGTKSAELANEYGVVMSTSHHEPCMRSGEEYGLMRGKDSIYGDAWNFRTNREGIIRFWRDGLVRNHEFENVITMGMRGERDSAILGEKATLEDNINLLRDVLKTQNQLIKETVNPNLEQVPRQMVFFTEVEEFFYGNKETKGLMDDPELEGVTLIFSDNNHGYTRTLPTEHMRNHKGGYGMYYHMDMHGGSHSYEWIGATYLPRVWEQMTMAYDYGVKNIWVTNVGDIGTQEFGLSYFLDLAYDIDKWGGNDIKITLEYTKQWVDKQFVGIFNEEDRKMITQIMWDYNELLVARKHEVMNAHVYHPLHFGEAEKILKISERILSNCQLLRAKCSEEELSSFVSLIYYPACGTANLMKMWIIAGRNELYAQQNRVETNDLANQIDECIQKDQAFIEDYESVDSGYYNGFGSTEHIGFTNWNDEDNKLPIRHYIYPAHKPRMLVARVEDEHYITAHIWCNNKQTWNDAVRQDVNEIEFDIICGSNRAIQYSIETTCPWISFSKTSGVVDVKERIVLSINRDLFEGEVSDSFIIKSAGIGEATVTVVAKNELNPYENVFMEHDGYIAMEASHYQKKVDVEDGSFYILSPYGRTGSAIKVYPTTIDFVPREQRPYVEYSFYANKSGKYNLYFYLSPSTPVVFESEHYIGYSMNEETVNIVNTVQNTKMPYFWSAQWCKEVLDNIKIASVEVECKEGVNQLRFYGMSPSIILERIVLCEKDTKLPESYLGPRESYIKRTQMN